MAPSSPFPLSTAKLQFSTQALPTADRRDWWREVICRHYAQVDIVSDLETNYYGETRILPLPDLQLSAVRSGTISIARQKLSPERRDQDAFFAVVLLSGAYRLQQDGREAILKPGDVAIYDATRPHRLDCLGDDFAKLIFAVPRSLLRSRFSKVDRCAAIRVAGDQGIGAIVSNFLRTSAYQLDSLTTDHQATINHAAIDMLCWNLETIYPIGTLSPNREQALTRVKTCITQHLRNPELNATMISNKVGLSARYINSLFAADDTSLMRYAMQCRLERCHLELASTGRGGLRISDVAFRWGFNDLSHFSRAFKRQYGLTPRQLIGGHTMHGDNQQPP